MIEIAVASDNFRHDDRSVEYCMEWCREKGCDIIEINTVNGEDFFEGLGFSPALNLNCDGIALKKQLDDHGLRLSQLDCHYAIHRWQSIPYMINGIKLAKAAGAPYIATTDGAEVPEGMTLEEVYTRAIYHLSEALPFARSHGVGINIEPHGPLTNSTEYMVRLMNHFKDEPIGVNFDTGNTYIAGNDPVEMMKKLLPFIRHFHVKDVAPELQEQVGEETGIASSEVFVGQGVNAKNIEKIVEHLKSKNWSGVMSLECRGGDNTAKSLEWMRGVLTGKACSKQS